MEFTTIIYKKEDSIGIMTLNRPKSMNAINSEFITGINLVLDEIGQDEEVAVVIIEGSEKFFAAGADIKEIIELTTPLDAHDFFTRVQLLFSRIYDLEKPFTAAARGFRSVGGVNWPWHATIDDRRLF